MKKISILKITLAIFSLIIAFNIGALAQKTDCTKTTDAEIVKAVMDKISVKYADQMSHINVHVENGVVMLEGWTTKKAVKDIAKIAKKVSCVKKVMNNLKVGIGGGCGAGQKPCGDTCIPSNQTCNISKGS